MTDTFKNLHIFHVVDNLVYLMFILLNDVRISEDICT